MGEEYWSVTLAACCHLTLIFAVMRLYNIYIFFKLLLSIAFFILKRKNLVMINRRNGPRYQRVLALCAFFNRGDTEGTNSSKILCAMFVYVLFYVNLCQDCFCGLWIICVQSK